MFNIITDLNETNEKEEVIMNLNSKWSSKKPKIIKKKEPVVTQKFVSIKERTQKEYYQNNMMLILLEKYSKN